MQFIGRSRRVGVAALGVTGLGAAAATLAAFPSVAQGAVAAVTSVSCSVTGSSWCISGNNSSSGIGVIGTSKTGTGLRGTSTSQYGLKATSGSGTAILAQTTSGSSAITAIGTSTEIGVSASGFTALYGKSSQKNGSGVYGANVSGDAVYGGSESGNGVHGYSDTATGGYFSSNSGYPLVLSDGNGKDVFHVDSDGDVSYTGTISQRSATAGGGTARSFNANTTQPTVEDIGTAQLVRGAAVVRLDPAFAASLEPTVGYHVFVTPNGETNELYVAGKTAAGFVVRESHAGRSTVTFDYRIVGTAFGKAGRHMALLGPAAARALAAYDPLPVGKAPKLPALLKAPAVEPATP